MRDPQERFKPQALLATPLEPTSEQMLAWFVRRWTLEVTCEEARAHLGMATQRQWHDRAMARTTPALVSLYSIMTLTAQLLNERERPVYAAQRGMAKRAPRFRRRWPGCGGSCGSISIFQRPNRRPI